MCWRDDVRQWRHCPFCSQEYYGDLGHKDCPKFKKPAGQYSGPSVVLERTADGKVRTIPAGKK